MSGKNNTRKIHVNYKYSLLIILFVAVAACVFLFLRYRTNPVTRFPSTGPAPTADLVGYWTFDTASIVGSTVLDSSGSGLNGTIVGSPVPIAGKIGEAFNFVGNGNYINFGDNGILDSKTEFTLSAWYQRNSPNAIVSMAKLGAGNIMLHTYSDGLVYTLIAGYAGYPDPNDTNWHLYTMVYNGSLGPERLTLYIDGSFVGDDQVGNAITNDSDEDFAVGNPNFSFNDGAIDDVRIYDRALSSSEVTDLYNYTGADIIAPVVFLAAPSNGDTVSGSAVALSATATDDVAVAGVQFKLDTNTNIGAEDTTDPYGATWDSTAVADGSHILTAVARDAANNSTTSPDITVTVENTAPEPPPPPPPPPQPPSPTPTPVPPAPPPPSSGGSASYPTPAISRAGINTSGVIHDGVLILDTSDGRTVYIISDGKKYGFTSEAVFRKFGFSFANAVLADLSQYQFGGLIESTASGHPYGSLVSIHGTIWYISGGKRYGFPTLEIFKSYGFSLDQVNSANSFDMALQEGQPLEMQK